MSSNPDLFSRQALEPLERDIALQSVAQQMSRELAAGDSIDRQQLSAAMTLAFDAWDSGRRRAANVKCIATRSFYGLSASAPGVSPQSSPEATRRRRLFRTGAPHAVR